MGALESPACVPGPSGRRSRVRGSAAGGKTPGDPHRDAPRRDRGVRRADPRNPAAGRDGANQPAPSPRALPARRRQRRARWLERLLDHAERILAGAYARRRFADGPRQEAFLGVTERTEAGGERELVSESRWLWVDIDDAERLDGLYAFLAERPCHLLVSTGGSGAGVHAYWRLDRPVAAVRVDARPVRSQNRSSGRTRG